MRAQLWAQRVPSQLLRAKRNGPPLAASASALTISIQVSGPWRG